MNAMLRVGMAALTSACGSGHSDARPIDVAAFEVVNPEVDLGVVRVGLEQQVRLRAMVGEAVELRDISRSCACASAAIEGLTFPLEILPGAAVRVAPGEVQIVLRLAIDRPGNGSIELGGLAWAGRRVSKWGVRVSYLAAPLLVYGRRREAELSGGAWVEIHTLSRTDGTPIGLRLVENRTDPQLPADSMLIGGCEPA